MPAPTKQEIEALIALIDSLRAQGEPAEAILLIILRELRRIRDQYLVDENDTDDPPTTQPDVPPT